jgi:hypothetical protein
LKLDPKNAFSGFCQNFPQAMDEVKNANSLAKLQLSLTSISKT